MNVFEIVMYVLRIELILYSSYFIERYMKDFMKATNHLESHLEPRIPIEKLSLRKALDM